VLTLLLYCEYINCAILTIVQEDIRAMALRVLREMIRCQPERFHSYAELTILKLLEAHKDPFKEVRLSI